MNLLKRLIVFAFNLHNKFLFNKKINKICQNSERLDRIPHDIIVKHSQLWGVGKPNLKWIHVYTSISGIIDHRYISEPDYYLFVEPRLNQKGLSEAYCDKNMYHRFLPHPILPEIYLRNIHGCLYDSKYNTLTDEPDLNKIIPDEIERIIVKNSMDTGGGRGIDLFEKKDGFFLNRANQKLSLNYLHKQYRKNYLIQEYVGQSEYFSRLNPSSLNTIRIFTYRSVKTNNIIPLQAVLRVGKPGALVDNQASGGVAIGIDRNGKPNSYAVNKMGTKFTEYNGIDLNSLSFVPLLSEMLEISTKIGKSFFYHRILGFDFAVDKKHQVRLIEVNNKNNEINFYQMNNGPLFGDYSKEISDYCMLQKSSFSADFEI